MMKSSPSGTLLRRKSGSYEASPESSKSLESDKRIRKNESRETELPENSRNMKGGFDGEPFFGKTY